jgi:hypothetical protein
MKFRRFAILASQKSDAKDAMSRLLDSNFQDLRRIFDGKSTVR